MLIFGNIYLNTEELRGRGAGILLA